MKTGLHLNNNLVAYLLNNNVEIHDIIWWVLRQGTRGRTVCQRDELTAHGEGSDQQGKLVCGHTAVGDSCHKISCKVKTLPIALT